MKTCNVLADTSNSANIYRSFSEIIVAKLNYICTYYTCGGRRGKRGDSLERENGRQMGD